MLTSDGKTKKVSVIANNGYASVDFIRAFVDPSSAGCAGEANTRFMTPISSR